MDLAARCSMRQLADPLHPMPLSERSAHRFLNRLADALLTSGWPPVWVTVKEAAFIAKYHHSGVYQALSRLGYEHPRFKVQLGVVGHKVPTRIYPLEKDHGLDTG